MLDTGPYPLFAQLWLILVENALRQYPRHKCPTGADGVFTLLQFEPLACTNPA